MEGGDTETWPAMELGAIPKRKGQAEKLATEVEDVQMCDNDTMTGTSIESLPDEVLEHILSLLSPYSDLESCALTCSRFCKQLSSALSRCQLKKSPGINYTAGGPPVVGG